MAEGISLHDSSVEATTSADSFTKKEASPEESIHVRDGPIYVNAPESSSTSTYSWPIYTGFESIPSAMALSPCIEEDTQDLARHVSKGTVVTPQNTSTSYTALSPALALQERNPRKRSLTEKARELLATPDTADLEIFYTSTSKQVAPTVPDTIKQEAGDSTQQASVNSVSPDQNITSCPMEPPSSKRKGHTFRAQPPPKRQKTPDVIMSSQSPPGKRRPGRPRKLGDDTPSMIFIGTSTSTANTEGSTSGTSVTTRSASTGSLKRSPTSPIYGPEFRLAYSSTASKLPAIPIAPATRLELSTPEPEKRRRGRPPKVAVEKSMPTAPVPIQPKPVANGDTIISAADGQ